MSDLRIAFRSDLAAAGWPERTIDGVFRRCGRREPGCRRPYVFVHDLIGKAASGGPPPPTTSEASATIGRAMGTAYIVARGQGTSRRFLVRFKLGGREAKIEHAGSVKGIVYTSVLRELMASRLAKG